MRSLGVTIPRLIDSSSLSAPPPAQSLAEQGNRRTEMVPAGLDRLYMDRFRKLFGYLARLTGDPELGSDIAQTTLVRLHESRPAPEEPGAWMVTVARNLLRDDRRLAGGRGHLALVRPDGLPGAESAPQSHEALETEERRLGVRTALDRLPERQRDALLLRHGGYSYREIALAVGVAEGGIGTLLLRATAAFRREYREVSPASD